MTDNKTLKITTQTSRRRYKYLNEAKFFKSAEPPDVDELSVMTGYELDNGS